MKYNWRLLLFIILAVAVLLVSSSDSYAQCSMCRAALAGSSN
jgi:hypothetical protein